MTSKEANNSTISKMEIPTPCSPTTEIMKTYAQKLRDPRWQRKRLEIMQRDNFTCTECGDSDSTLNVHHWEYAKEPWDAKNADLVTVCEKCHKEIEDCKKLTKLFLRNDGFRDFMKKVEFIDNTYGAVNCTAAPFPIGNDNVNIRLFYVITYIGDIVHVLKSYGHGEVVLDGNNNTVQTSEIMHKECFISVEFLNLNKFWLMPEAEKNGKVLSIDFLIKTETKQSKSLFDQLIDDAPNDHQALQQLKL